MKNPYFTNENQVEKWIEAAERIEGEFGIEKALGYLIGEKFYTIVRDNHMARKMIRIIHGQRKQPVREMGGRFQKTINLDNTFRQCEQRVIVTEQILREFADLIKRSFELYEIRDYFDSNPRLGSHGHTTSEEQFDYLVQQGAIEHSIETELEDALILGDMMKYLQIT